MNKLQLAIIAVGLSAAATASAQTTSTSFGPLAGATFAGSGIPNDAVEVTTIQDLSDTITLGLAATPRNQVGELVNNGNGTFYAAPGTQWNFDYYVSISGPDTLSAFNFVLDYDLIPGTPLGSWNLSASYVGPTTTIFQDSQYPGFGFLASSAAEPHLIPPTAPYNIDSSSQVPYQFVLNAYSGNTLIGQSAIDVVVPEPTTIIVGALTLLPFGASTLRFLRKNRAP